MYKDRYFDADKQGLSAMLDTSGQDGNRHSDSARRGRGYGAEIFLVDKETTEQINNDSARK
jgi:hypothetical protein